jgi:hypothetical protein
MKNVKYEGVYPCMHNNSIQILLFISRRKINGLALLFLRWMKKWKEEARDNQSLYNTTMKAYNKFKYTFRGNIRTTV